MCDVCTEIDGKERASLPALTRLRHGLPIGGERRVPWMFPNKDEENCDGE